MQMLAAGAPRVHCNVGCGQSTGYTATGGLGLGQMEEEEKCLVTFSPTSASEDVGC